MTWLRRAWYRLRFRGLPAENLLAIEVRVYKVRQGCLLLAASEGGSMSLILDRPHTLALIDSMLETIEEAEPQAPLAS